jgi:D-aminoacyl-tRNA deacylase
MLYPVISTVTNKRPIVVVLVLPLLVLFVCLHSVEAMRLVVQRVKSASVSVESSGGGHRDKVVSNIGPGILALVGLHEDDTEQDLQYCCKRLLGCKLWENENGGQWRHSVIQKQYECLLVSQFTLYGTLSKKHQPDYKLAMKAIPAEQLYRQFVEMVRAAYLPEKIHDGVFGAMMDVSLVNDGPVTLVIESDVQRRPEQLPSDPLALVVTDDSRSEPDVP